jgi:NAD(P)H-hydrate epimerase
MGAVDVVTDGETTRRCRTGGPGMAVGGTGDVLSGVVAGFLGSAWPLEAASAASFATGRAGERVAETHGDGLLASDLLEAIPAVVNEA